MEASMMTSWQIVLVACGLTVSAIAWTWLINLTLLLGVWERWLAGEPPAAPAAWAKAARFTRAEGRRGVLEPSEIWIP